MLQFHTTFFLNIYNIASLISHIKMKMLHIMTFHCHQQLYITTIVLYFIYIDRDKYLDEFKKIKQKL